MPSGLTPFIATILATALAGVALTPTQAQDVPSQPAGHVEQGVFVPEGNTLSEVLEQQAANRAQAEAARQAMAENEARLTADAQAQAAYQAELKRVEEEKSAIEAQAAKAAADHDAAMTKWRADVAACKEGDASRCAPKAEN